MTYEQWCFLSTYVECTGNGAHGFGVLSEAKNTTLCEYCGRSAEEIHKEALRNCEQNRQYG